MDSRDVAPLFILGAVPLFSLAFLNNRLVEHDLRLPRDLSIVLAYAGASLVAALALWTSRLDPRPALPLILLGLGAVAWSRASAMPTARQQRTGRISAALAVVASILFGLALAMRFLADGA